MQATLPKQPKRIGFLLIPQFSMMCFSSTLEPLRAANRLRDQDLYTWQLYSIDGEPVLASNGITLVPDGKLAEPDWPQLLIVCTGINVEAFATEPMRKALRSHARRGIALGGISTGSYLLAYAGLLNNYRCTIHWENLLSFRESFPALTVTDNIYEIDRDRYTCAGGTAGLDMMLNLIAEEHGNELTTAISDQFMHDRARAPGDQQRKAQELSLSQQSPKLAAAIKNMQSNVETPLATGEVARRVGVSLRQLERLFQRYRGCTPQRYYLDLRLQQSRRLLAQTGLSVMNVALATGFASQSHFTKCYRENFGRTPQQERTVLL